MSDVTTATRSATAAVCVDASLVVRLLDGALAAMSVWERFTRADTRLTAPALLGYEVANALHQQRRAGVISRETAEYQLDRSTRLPIELHGDAALHVRALELAGTHRLPATYEAHYLALAERYRVPLWTCDRRLVDAVGEQLPWVHLVS